MQSAGMALNAASFWTIERTAGAVRRCRTVTSRLLRSRNAFGSASPADQRHQLNSRNIGGNAVTHVIHRIQAALARWLFLLPLAEQLGVLPILPLLLPRGVS
jgi:hypothetical protein